MQKELHVPVAEWIVIPLLPFAPIRNTCRHTKGQEENELAIKRSNPKGQGGLEAPTYPGLSL